MSNLHFNMQLMNYLADHRTPFLTHFFLFFTDIGEINAYIVVATFIYVMFDKTLAVRLMVVVLLTLGLNHILKILIKNPRPFVREGTYLRKWAVTSDYAHNLVMEYSTPSGHAMASAGFYSYLYACAKSPAVRIASVVLIVLIGLSRPYLGVHYLEDVVLGWAMGFAVAMIAVAYGENIAAAWMTRSYAMRAAVLVFGSLALWVASSAAYGCAIDTQPRAFVAYAGSLTGVLLAQPLELRFVDFDPRSGNVGFKLVRFGLSVGLALAALSLLEIGFRRLAPDYSLSGYALQYVRYAAAGAIDIFFAPLLFTRLGLAVART